jgi:hypothetical protein
MRAGRTVTVREFVEAYCELEETPLGRVVTWEAVERLRRLAAERAAHIRDVGVPVPEGAPAPAAGAGARREAAVWYVVAVGPDARSVEEASDAAVIRRLPEAVFACIPRDLAQRLRRERRPNVHVYPSAGPAVAAFGVFDRA